MKVLIRSFFACLLLILISSCGGGPNYVITIQEPNMDDKIAGDTLDIHVAFDEADGKTIDNISVNLVTKDEGNLLYTLPLSLQSLNVGGHYDHFATFKLDVQPGIELVLEASAFEDGEGESKTVRESVTFRVN